MTSSHASPFLHRSWSRDLPCRLYGDANPKGSYRELIADKIPCLVGGLSLTEISKLKVLEWTSQRTPNALSTGRRSKSMDFTEPDLSLSGIVSRTL